MLVEVYIYMHFKFYNCQFCKKKKSLDILMKALHLNRTKCERNSDKK